ncbi:hypothetical protein C8J57DRAFT_1222491 [Mycena rebaudengoi]|nr:hypothetical protein C8J57DRAFT_1222491 [Mycena rebaudengoi]
MVPPEPPLLRHWKPATRRDECVEVSNQHSDRFPMIKSRKSMGLRKERQGLFPKMRLGYKLGSKELEDWKRGCHVAPIFFFVFGQWSVVVSSLKKNSFFSLRFISIGMSPSWEPQEQESAGRIGRALRPGLRMWWREARSGTAESQQCSKGQPVGAQPLGIARHRDAYVNPKSGVHWEPAVRKRDEGEEWPAGIPGKLNGQMVTEN